MPEAMPSKADIPQQTPPRSLTLAAIITPILIILIAICIGLVMNYVTEDSSRVWDSGEVDFFGTKLVLPVSVQEFEERIGADIDTERNSKLRGTNQLHKKNESPDNLYDIVLAEEDIVEYADGAKEIFAYLPDVVYLDDNKENIIGFNIQPSGSYGMTRQEHQDLLLHIIFPGDARIGNNIYKIRDQLSTGFLKLGEESNKAGIYTDEEYDPSVDQIMVFNGKEFDLKIRSHTEDNATDAKISGIGYMWQG